jgi:hypothetical protein
MAARTGEQRKAHAGAEGSAWEQNCRRQRAGAEGGSAREQKAARAGEERTRGGQREGAEGSARGRRAHGKRTTRGSRRQRARQLFVSTRPARSRWIPAVCCRPFFFPTRPERLNRAQGDASTHQVMPYSPRSWRQRRSKILHAPTLKRRSGDALKMLVMSIYEGLEKATRGGRGLNGSQSKFLEGTRAIS